MSESTRALCQIIEARPFLTLTDEELELVVLALTNEAQRAEWVPGEKAAHAGTELRHLAETAWRETKARGETKARAEMQHRRQLWEGRWPEPERCESTRTFFDGERQPLVPTRCEGIRDHDGRHFTGDHATRTEWS